MLGWCIPFYYLWHVSRQKLHTKGVPNTKYIVLNVSTRATSHSLVHFVVRDTASISFSSNALQQHNQAYIFFNFYGARVKNFKNAASSCHLESAQGTRTLRERSTAHHSKKTLVISQATTFPTTLEPLHTTPATRQSSHKTWTTHSATASPRVVLPRVGHRHNGHLSSVYSHATPNRLMLSAVLYAPEGVPNDKLLLDTDTASTTVAIWAERLTRWNTGKLTPHSRERRTLHSQKNQPVRTTPWHTSALNFHKGETWLLALPEALNHRGDLHNIKLGSSHWHISLPLLHRWHPNAILIKGVFAQPKLPKKLSPGFRGQHDKSKCHRRLGFGQTKSSTEMAFNPTCDESVSVEWWHVSALPCPVSIYQGKVQPFQRASEIDETAQTEGSDIGSTILRKSHWSTSTRTLINPLAFLAIPQY